LTLEDAIELCADMLVIMDSENGRVLRCGLPPLTAETQQQILAGPWHPAFGFLARARLRRRQIESLLHRYYSAGAPRVLRLTVPEKALEECAGMRGENRRWFQDHYGTRLELTRGPVTAIAPAE
jgi:hypothetical protein